LAFLCTQTESLRAVIATKELSGVSVAAKKEHGIHITHKGKKKSK